MLEQQKQAQAKFGSGAIIFGRLSLSPEIEGGLSISEDSEGFGPIQFL
jgi:hypothetical protein